MWGPAVGVVLTRLQSWSRGCRREDWKGQLTRQGFGCQVMVFGLYQEHAEDVNA